MIDVINRLVWSIAFVFLIGSGLYFTFKLRFRQFNIKGMIDSFKYGNDLFSSLSMSLGARIGVGSLAGVGLAIKMGGVGTIFWIWISSIIVVINSFVESFLAVKYKMNNIGGPSYYIRDGLGKKRLSFVYAFLIIITYIFGFLTIQSNTITRVFNGFGFSSLLIGFIIVIISSYIIFGGDKYIISFMSKLVPIMCLIYLLVGLYILFININVLPSIILSIIKEAFNYKSLGIGVITSLIIGFRRGIFSTEAGIGTGAIASSTSLDNSPIRQGYVQIVGVYFTSLVICTITALIILTSNYNSVIFNSINGIEITSYAFNYHLGRFGDFILIISIILFSFSTIIAGYYYGENNLKFITSKGAFIFILKIVTLILLFIGSVMSAGIIWNMVDILVGLLAIINVSSLFMLRKKIEIK